MRNQYSLKCAAAAIVSRRPRVCQRCKCVFTTLGEPNKQPQMSKSNQKSPNLSACLFLFGVPLWFFRFSSIFRPRLPLGLRRANGCLLGKYTRAGASRWQEGWIERGCLGYRRDLLPSFFSPLFLKRKSPPCFFQPPSSFIKSKLPTLGGKIHSFPKRRGRRRRGMIVKFQGDATAAGVPPGGVKNLKENILSGVSAMAAVKTSLSL